MDKRILAFLLTIAMIMVAVPVVPGERVAYASQGWAGSVSFDNDTTIADGVTLTGDTTLTVAEGVVLTVNNGIVCDGYTLTIDGPGSVSVNGSSGKNGSAGGSGISGNVILITGQLTVTGGAGGALS